MPYLIIILLVLILSYLYWSTNQLEKTFCLQIQFIESSLARSLDVQDFIKQEIDIVRRELNRCNNNLVPLFTEIKDFNRSVESNLQSIAEDLKNIKSVKKNVDKN